MNVARLLQDSPSDDHDRRRQQQQRERERDQQQQHQQQQHQQPQPPPQQAPLHHTPPAPQDRPYDRDRPPQPRPHISPSQPHPQPPPPHGQHAYRQQPPPPSPHRPNLPPEYGQVPRAPYPPPPYERRPVAEPPLQRELSAPLHHRPSPGLGPPGPSAQAYNIEQRTLPPPPPRTHPGQHQQHHQQHVPTHPNTPSQMYMPPLSRPAPPHSTSVGPPKMPPSGPGIPPPGHGSIPLYPTPVGPGVPPGAPPRSAPNPGPGIPPRSLPSPRLEPSTMYGAPQVLPPSSVHHAGPHHGAPPRVSGNSEFERRSPVMASLQRPFDERDRDRDRDRDRERGDRARDRERERDRELRDSGTGGPRVGPQTQHPSQFSSPPGPLHSGVAGVGHAVSPPVNARISGQHVPPHMLTGPGAMGMNQVLGLNDRERERDRAMERDGRGTAIGEPGGRRERERAPGRDREPDKERERQRQREMDGGRPVDGGMFVELDAEREREREWYHRSQMQGHPFRDQGQPHSFWSRFAPSRAGSMSSTGPFIMEDDREGPRRMHEMDIERERERERALRAEHAQRNIAPREQILELEDQHMRDVHHAEWEAEKAARSARSAQVGKSSSKDKSAREREKEKEERRIAKQASAREEQMDERERIMRERDREWKEAERERAQREHMQMERNAMDIARAQRQGQLPTPQHHHHHHVHHHHVPSSSSHSQGHAPGAKSVKSGSMSSSSGMMPPAIGPGMMPGEMQVPFGHIQQLPGAAQYVQTPPQPPNGPMTSSSLPHVQIPSRHHHQHPSLQHSISTNSIHQPHVHPHLVSNSHPGFSQRRTPPPGFAGSILSSSSAPTNLIYVNRSPSPRIAHGPVAPSISLGTFVYPRTPFPFLDFPDAGSAERDMRELRATILIPCGFLPTRRPARPRIWGGALIPALPPLPPAQQAGHHPAYSRPTQLELRGMRRVYTDDSDLFLCALHAGLLTWSRTRRAKSEGRDLRVEVRITKEARFIGGLGSPYVKRMDHGSVFEMDVDGDDGSSLLSAGWGNSHDGAGIEVLAAMFVEKGTAHSFGLRNRPQRLEEYAVRRSVLCDCEEPPLKRQRLSSIVIEPSDSSVALGVSDEDAELSASMTIVFGEGKTWQEIRFKNSSALRSTVSPPLSPKPETAKAAPSPTRKRARSSSPAPDQPSEPLQNGTKVESPLVKEAPSQVARSEGENDSLLSAAVKQKPFQEVTQAPVDVKPDVPAATVSNPEPVLVPTNS